MKAFSIFRRYVYNTVNVFETLFSFLVRLGRGIVSDRIPSLLSLVGGLRQTGASEVTGVASVR